MQGKQAGCQCLNITPARVMHRKIIVPYNAILGLYPDGNILYKADFVFSGLSE
jgi:hypothetical protein